MFHRTPSGDNIGSTQPNVQTTDSTHLAIPQSSQTAQLEQNNAQSYKFERLPSFPRTLFALRKYDGAKALTALLLILATSYFLLGFFGFVVDHTAWLRELLHKAPLPDVVAKPVWWQFWKTIGTTVTHVASYVDLVFRFFIFICAYCLAWAAFDPRNIEGYVMGLFNTCLGIAYMVAPIDMIPDFIPVVGSLDDTFAGMGVCLLGLSSVYRHKLREVKTKTILELIDDGNNQRALKMLLEDKGITIKTLSSDTKK